MFRKLTPSQRTVDGLIAVAFVVLVALFSGVGVDGGAFAVILGGALALRRWAPALALGLAWVSAILNVGLSLEVALWNTAIPPVVYACAAYGSRGVRWAAFASTLVGGGVAGVYFAVEGARDAVLAPPELGQSVVTFTGYAVMTAVVLLLAWTLGLLVRTAGQSRRNREQAAAADRETAAEQERVRIARDMHDVVAHSLAVVIAQSDGARMLGRTDPAAVDEALGTIGSTARAALADVRVLLQQLRYEGTTEVQPGLADLPLLLEQFRASGLHVELETDGEVEHVGTAAGLAAFRIVQESLTNALRHGDLDRPASVVLRRTGHGLAVGVESAIAAGGPVRAGGGGGHGLIGMRERAASVQGDLRAGPEGDRFRVRAFLPSSATAAVPVVAR